MSEIAEETYSGPAM